MEVSIHTHNSFSELMSMSMYRFNITREAAATILRRMKNPDEDIHVMDSIE